jgi:CheY-like chemotaxis protein
MSLVPAGWPGVPRVDEPSDQELTVLVAAEAPWELEALAQALRAGGYAVVVARNGLEVLEEIHRRRLDVLVLDTMMSYVEGMEVLRRLKASPTTAKLPVVMLTPKVAEVQANRSIQAHIEELGTTGLLKPVETEELLQVIRRLLQG